MRQEKAKEKAMTRMLWPCSQRQPMAVLVSHRNDGSRTCGACRTGLCMNCVPQQWQAATEFCTDVVLFFVLCHPNLHAKCLGFLVPRTHQIKYQLRVS